MLVTLILQLLPPAICYRVLSRQLQALDDRMLSDIGISRGQIEQVVRGRL